MKKQLALVSLVVLGLSGMTGCGVGVILFDAKNGGPPKRTGAAAQVFQVDCVDGFEASGGQTALGAQAGTYSVGCTYQGQPMPWNVLGVFHAAPMAAGKWDKYSAAVVKKATGKGCPGVAVRNTPPTKNQEGEAIGAFCVALQ